MSRKSKLRVPRIIRALHLINLELKHFITKREERREGDAEIVCALLNICMDTVHNFFFSFNMMDLSELTNKIKQLFLGLLIVK